MSSLTGKCNYYELKTINFQIFWTLLTRSRRLSFTIRETLKLLSKKLPCCIKQTIRNLSCKITIVRKTVLPRCNLVCRRLIRPKRQLRKVLTKVKHHFINKALLNLIRCPKWATTQWTRSIPFKRKTKSLAKTLGPNRTTPRSKPMELFLKIRTSTRICIKIKGMQFTNFKCDSLTNQMNC